MKAKQPTVQFRIWCLVLPTWSEGCVACVWRVTSTETWSCCPKNRKQFVTELIKPKYLKYTDKTRCFSSNSIWQTLFVLERRRRDFSLSMKILGLSQTTKCQDKGIHAEWGNSVGVAFSPESTLRRLNKDWLTWVTLKCSWNRQNIPSGSLII